MCSSDLCISMGSRGKNWTVRAKQSLKWCCGKKCTNFGGEKTFLPVLPSPIDQTSLPPARLLVPVGYSEQRKPLKRPKRAAGDGALFSGKGYHFSWYFHLHLTQLNYPQRNHMFRRGNRLSKAFFRLLNESFPLAAA